MGWSERREKRLGSLLREESLGKDDNDEENRKPLMNVVKDNEMKQISHVTRKEESDWMRGVMGGNKEVGNS